MSAVENDRFQWKKTTNRCSRYRTTSPHYLIYPLAESRAFETYLKKGYTEDWIHQRILSIRVRNELTAEWQQRGVKKGDKVIMYTSSSPELIYVVLALCKIGATANMLNPLFENEQVIERINETGAAIMIALDELYCKLSDDICKTCIKTVIILPVYNSMSKIAKNIAKLKNRHKISYSSFVLHWSDFIKVGKNL